MADNSSYDRARDLAEEALKKTVEGDNETAEELAQKAKARGRKFGARSTENQRRAW